MKPCIIFALLLLVTSVVMAQQPPVSADVKKRLEELKRYRDLSQSQAPMVYALPSQDTTKEKQFRKWLEAQRLQKAALVTGTFSHTTGKGKVYTLTPDNMPCLVPDMKSVAAMPNARNKVIMDDRINALPRQRIIPREEEKDKK